MLVKMKPHVGQIEAPGLTRAPGLDARSLRLDLRTPRLGRKFQCGYEEVSH